MPHQPKQQAPAELLIKNMVCQRCIRSVEQVLEQLQIPFAEVCLGEVKLLQQPTADQKAQLATALQALGFELIATRVQGIIEQIKRSVLQYLDLGDEAQGKKLSSFITKDLPYDYSYLSDLFSSIEGKTIEQYFLQQRIERVKELLVYDELSLTQIAWQTGFSSVHHLSAQFKKLTGLTPTHFKKIGASKRQTRDGV